MSWSVIVPFRGDRAERDRNWAWCRSRLKWQMGCLGEAELIEADSGDEVFNRARSRNVGASQAKGDLLVFMDADGANDNWIDAGLEVHKNGGWVVCYRAPDGYVALTRESTEWLLRTPRTWRPLDEPGYAASDERSHSYAGCLVCSAEDFALVGGYDERFNGWGYEDDAFREAMETVVAPHKRTEGFHLHLWHPHVESERFNQPHIAENKALAESYTAARGDRDAMLKIVGDR